MKSKEWDGSGLPPVGTVCEFSSEGHHSDPEYQWCIFHGLLSCGGYIIEFHHHTAPDLVTCDAFDPRTTKIRPSKTPEQIAREERSEAIEEMVEVLIMHGKTLRGDMRVLYDAGYRKTEVKK